MLDALRQGLLIADDHFDQLYPPELQTLSLRHWTPMQIATRAAAFLAQAPGARILDIGSGAGKFCLIGALTTQGHFTGVEQRTSLLDVATAIAQTHRIHNAQFVRSNMLTLDWSEFNAFYFFNPFLEQLDATARIDLQFRFSEGRHEFYLEAVRKKLSAARIGTRVATYHGFGGSLPEAYKLVLRDLRGTGPLEFFIKAS